jgi:hypothetical protein
MERVLKVRIHRAANTARTYDAITVYVADLQLSCDLVNDRQIRLARRLATSHGAALQVAPELEERVRAALAGRGEHMDNVPEEFRGIVEETAAILAEVAK